ncbi:ankyrin repeats (3 copies) domain-containing protein [Trichoderma breve]|uniref:Ankyrin repeats (3 copies) domain-containing protein n=1 Tax=Trichoderma breve TaxID=2034170 RepID=A0A9W9BB97_9HYPO|nr:ankyrin repeats (3 copies) domain-containing protein [Trichoderma breve]KAJ4856666.1 ankyrin repeats (3 copies) domain-containing protein [Trichoderma breve]
MVARLFLTVAPQAELYIAKVADKQEMLDNQLHRITEAIKWAVLECDVDIISMSLLLPREHSGIDKELTETLSPSSQDAKRKLVFAAAGNFGLFKQRAFPARKEGVIAVHAADGSGDEPRFVPNPESKPDPESELNLSTLGENIKMRWPDSDNPGEMKDIYISGSSYATPIAAGIAANVLEFARHRLKMNEWMKDEIYSHHGMAKILKAMSCRRGGCDFVHPLAFWERAFHGGIWETQMLPHDNPLNSILFDQPWAISLEPQSDFTKGDIRAGTGGLRTGATKRTPKVDMITDDEYEAETSSSNPSNLCSTQATEDYRAENCIAKHPRELPLHVAFRITDDDDHQQGCDVPPSRCSDRDRFEHEDLPKLGLEELEYFEVKTTAELPFEIPKSSQYERPTIPTIVPVKAKSQNTRRQFVMEKFNLESELGEGADERMKRLCLKEAMTLWHARHQHVIEVAMAFTFEGDDTDDVEGPYFGIIMELAEQGDISRHLACQRPPAERAKISTWFACLTNAIAYIHSIGIRRRDIKPGNILLKKDGSVKLADFGISKMRLGRTSSTTTPEGPRANTPRYAAPEVGEGGTRGRQADIFALGAVFLEMLIAHSFKHLRPQLSEKLKPSRLGARFGRDVSGPAYAPSLRKIHDWINEIQADLTCGEEHWHRTILSLCLRMTSEIREARPSAEEVYSIISGSESLKNEAHEAGSSCNCDVASVQTENQKLIEACQRLDGYDEVVSLLENENNLQTKGAIQQAASHGRLSVVQQFLARGADVNQLDYCNQTALHCAAACGHADVAKLLLEHGAKIDIKDEEEQLPLHCASGQGQLEVVETLLAHDITGATSLSTDCYEQMPLHCAAKRGFTNVVRFLIGRMNNNSSNDDAVVKTDARQRTALHLAAGYGSEAVVRLLLDKVTDKGFVDSLDEIGMTALHWATIGRQRNGSYTKVMEVLLERGADVNIRGGAGYKTAIDHARDNRDEERIAVLLRADKIAR